MFSENVLLTIALVGFSVAVINDSLVLNKPVGDRADPVGRWKFLTWLTLVGHVAYCTASLLTPNRKAFKRTLDKVFVGVIYPFGLFVCSAFWILFYIDRELVYPAELDKLIPSWHNHLVHTLPMIFGAISLLLLPKKIPSQMTVFFMNFSVLVCYVLWVIYVGDTFGAWAYPMLRDLTTLERLGFVAVLQTWETSYFVLGYRLLKWRWGR